VEKDAGVAGGRSGSGNCSLVARGNVSLFFTRTGSGMTGFSYAAVSASLFFFSTFDSGQELRGSGLEVTRVGIFVGRGGGAIDWGALKEDEVIDMSVKSVRVEVSLVGFVTDAFSTRRALSKFGTA
jgi:hypothetical protein